LRLDKTLSAKLKKVLASSLSGLVGRISIDPNQGRTNVYETVDVGNVNTDGGSYSHALYGLPNECSGPTGPSLSCRSFVHVLYDNTGIPTMAWQGGEYGWDSAATAPQYLADSSTESQTGSHLVKLASVPTPPALWLFGPGLLGLIGIARRRKAA